MICGIIALTINDNEISYMINKGFIFDLDGVIVDTAKYHYLAWQN
jgi:hypothetical protein